MSINRQSFLAFTAEITKTAGLIGTLKHWTREGWHNPMGGGVPQANAAPAGSFSARHPGWMGSSKRWGKIPVGMKSMTVGMTALQLPGALKTEDPSGQGKSRAERVADLGGQTVGGLTAAGAANAAVKRLNLQAGRGMKSALQAGAGTALRRGGRFMGRNALVFGLPMAGALAAGKIMASPFALARKRRQAQMQAQPAPGDQPSPNPGLHGTPAETPVAQEGQQGQMR